MDPERQPLLGPSTSTARCRNRPLTCEEVKASRRELPWRRTHMILVLVFWGAIAMLISMIVCMLMTSRPCAGELGPAPSVPAAHLTFAPLISRTRFINHVYAM